MDRWRGKVAVVTGASSGIGADFCKRLVEEGLLVVGLARRLDKLQELATLCKGPGKYHPVQCDITKEEEVGKTFKWIKENVGPVQIMINNAGLYKPGLLIESKPECWEATLDTNVKGLLMCTREAFLHMKEKDLPGHIVHVNSISGHYNISGGESPFMNMYSPSKHAVTDITEIMRKELFYRKANVKITSLSPGVVKTEITKTAGVFLHEISDIPYLNCEDISDSLIYLLSTPPHVQIQELTIRHLGEGVYF